MKIDSHMHVNFKRLGVKELISYMDREGIDKCWLLTWEEVQPPASIYYQHLSIHDVFRAYENHPSRIVPMYAPDPNRPDAAERFMEWHKRGVRGCGELKVTLGWDSPKLDRLLSCLNELGVPLVFHMERARYLFRPMTMLRSDEFFARLLNTPRLNALPRRVIEAVAGKFRPLEERKEKMRFFFPGYLLDFAALEKRLREFQNIKFVGHGPLFWSGFAPAMGGRREGEASRLLAEYGNLYADISAHSGSAALKRDPGFTRDFFIRHSGKILYGTDNFFLGLRRFLDTLALPEDVGKRIYGGNAEGLLNHGSDSWESELAS